MKHYNPITTEPEFEAVCKSNLDAFQRIVDYVIADLDSGWRNLSRRESDIRKHQLQFLEDLQTRVENAALGSINPTIRY